MDNSKDIIKAKPSDFLKAGDTVIFPADYRGIRLIKIVPNTDSEYVLFKWRQHGAVPFTGKIPKSGYVFEDDISKRKPEQIDDGRWESTPYFSLPPAKPWVRIPEKPQDKVAPPPMVLKDEKLVARKEKIRTRIFRLLYKPFRALTSFTHAFDHKDDAVIISITCKKCGYERTIHQPAKFYHDPADRDSWCSQCNKKTSHTFQIKKRVPVLPKIE
jgi:hypothetical protein